MEFDQEGRSRSSHEVSGSSGSRCFDVGMAMRTMVNYAECQHENSYPKESSDAEKVELQEDIPGLHPPSGAVAKEERTSCDYGKSSDLKSLEDTRDHGSFHGSCWGGV